MDWNDYVTRELIEQRLAERRTEAAVVRLLAEGREPPPPLRVSVGDALIRLGSWMVGKGLTASCRRA